MKIIVVMLILLVSNSRTLQAQGCYFSSMSSFGGQPTSYSGNANLDQFLNNEYYKLVQVYGVQPASFYIVEDSGPNAFATPTISNQNYRDGTVVLGLNLITSECGQSYSGTCVGMAVVMAHEFAHIWDFKNGFIRTQSPKYRELFADYMAGAYLHTRELTHAYTNVIEAAGSIYSKGDYFFNSPLHHGTNQERMNALIAGYNYSKTMVSRGIYSLTTAQVAASAKQYLNIR